MLDNWREMMQSGYQITRVEADQCFWGAHWRVESPSGWVEERYDAGWISTHDGKDEEWVQRIEEAQEKQRKIAEEKQWKSQERALRPHRPWWQVWKRFQ